MDGTFSRDLFHDVSSINRELDEKDHTYNLFLHLNSSSPVFAARCFSMALSAIIVRGDYALAKTFIKDPEEKIRRWAKRLNEELEYLATQPPSPAPREATEISIYAEDVARLLKILSATGDASEAIRLRALSVGCIASSTTKSAVERDLTVYGADA